MSKQETFSKISVLNEKNISFSLDWPCSWFGASFASWSLKCQVNKTIFSFLLNAAFKWLKMFALCLCAWVALRKQKIGGGKGCGSHPPMVILLAFSKSWLWLDYSFYSPFWSFIPKAHYSQMLMEPEPKPLKRAFSLSLCETMAWACWALSIIETMCAFLIGLQWGGWSPSPS